MVGTNFTNSRTIITDISLIFPIIFIIVCGVDKECVRCFSEIEGMRDFLLIEQLISLDISNYSGNHYYLTLIQPSLP